jgi:ribA/ribD-fused uncharacterized protein
MITSFEGQYRFLSNFEPVFIERDDLIYPSVEHAFQAAKSESRDFKLRISRLKFAGQAKKAGKITPVPNWDQLKIPLMLSLLRLKFQVPHLREALLATGDQEIQEGNYWGDEFWGVCKGKGENHLGKLLMQVRQEIRQEALT